MARITGLETQKSDAERVTIYLDGAFGLGAAAMVVLARGLHVGMELSDSDVEELRRDDSAERAYAAALNFLSFRPRSGREIRDYLRRKGVEPSIVEAAISRLERAGLLDDRAFARYWVHNRQTFRPRGARALRMEMRMKGLDSETVEDALEQLGDEEETAYRAALTKARSYAGLDEREFFRKLAGFLQRRGFSYEVAAVVTRRLYAEGTPPSESD